MPGDGAQGQIERRSDAAIRNTLNKLGVKGITVVVKASGAVHKGDSSTRLLQVFRLFNGVQGFSAGCWGGDFGKCLH